MWFGLVWFGLVVCCVLCVVLWLWFLCVFVFFLKM